MPKPTSTPSIHIPAPAQKPDGKSKTYCPVTRQQFTEQAKSIVVELVAPDGTRTRVIAEVKEFSTGSLGWFTNEKVTLGVGGTPVKVQLNMSCTIVNSKELPK